MTPQHQQQTAFRSGVAFGAIVGIAIGIIVGLCCGIAYSQDDVVPTPRAAVGWAAEHLAQQPEGTRNRWRYIVADPWAEKDWIAAVTVGLNTAVNREPIPFRPDVLANGWMVAVDFARLCSDEHERATVLAVWDGLAVREPYFHVPQVNTGLKVPVVASHLPVDHVQVVVAWSEQENRHGVVPIYRAGFALSQMLAAEEGVYYQLRGTPSGGGREGCPTCQGRGGLKLTSSGRTIPCPDCQGGGTDEDRWLAKWGLSTAKSAAFRSDLRKGIFRSNVTSFPRGAVAVRGFVGSAWLTEDVQGNDPTKHPIHSLLPGADGKLPADAKEDIAEMPNGYHDFLLTDGTGRRQNLAILNGQAVTDTTVPSPHPGLLQPAISCIRCHWTKDFSIGEEKFAMSGLHPVANDVATLLAPEGGVNILAFRDAELSRLAGLYAGSHLFDQSLQLGRARLSIAVQQSTGLSVQAAGLAVMSLFNRYRYANIDAATACLELGVRVPAESDGRTELAGMIGGAADNPDATLLALLRGLSVRREDWERVYSDAATRSLARNQDGGEQ
jgi:hypothetical protein